MWYAILTHICGKLTQSCAQRTLQVKIAYKVAKLLVVQVRSPLYLCNRN